MIQDSVNYLVGEIKPGTVLLKKPHYPDALFVMLKASLADSSKRPLAGMSEGCVPEIVSEGNRFGQIFVHPKRLRDGPRNLRNLQRMRKPRPIMVAVRCQEDLRLILKPAERLRVNDPVPVPLEHRPDITLRLLPFPAL